MDNHKMYYCDKDGDLELTRCSFCQFMTIRSNAMNCIKGNDCKQDNCNYYLSIKREKTARRIESLKKIQK